jgi:hypothetical protein
MTLRDDLLTEEVADFVRVASQVQGALGSTQIALLRARETALADAAAALTRAELLHRAAVACPEREDPANACPACGRVFKSPQSLGLHLAAKSRGQGGCVDAPSCPKCKVALKPGQAMLPVVGGLPDSDIGGDVVTVSVVGGKLGPCLKCPECGYSVTA